MNIIHSTFDRHDINLAYQAAMSCTEGNTLGFFCAIEDALSSLPYGFVPHTQEEILEHLHTKDIRELSYTDIYAFCIERDSYIRDYRIYITPFTLPTGSDIIYKVEVVSYNGFGYVGEVSNKDCFTKENKESWEKRKEH